MNSDLLHWYILQVLLCSQIAKKKNQILLPIWIFSRVFHEIIWNYSRNCLLKFIWLPTNQSINSERKEHHWSTQSQLWTDAPERYQGWGYQTHKRSSTKAASVPEAGLTWILGFNLKGLIVLGWKHLQEKKTLQFNSHTLF